MVMASVAIIERGAPFGAPGYASRSVEIAA